MNIILYIIIFTSILISLFISIILRQLKNKISSEDHLPINSLIINISDLLFMTNMINGISFLIYKNKKIFATGEYMTIVIYSFYKSFLYTTITLILFGWMTISFFGWKERFKLINKIVFFYELISLILILLSVYFIHIISKLNLMYIKDILEYSVLLSYSLYCIFKKIIPLGKQMNYEQRIHSYLARCIRNKFKTIFFTTLIMIIYSLFFMIIPIFDYKYIYSYIDNYNIHLIFQLFYETIFFLFFTFVLYPKKLPNYYFDEIFFNYKEKFFFFANISEKENNITNKLNISNLSFHILKKFSKEDNYPIVFLNPYSSDKKNSLFNEIYIGIAQRYKK